MCLTSTSNIVYKIQPEQQNVPEVFSALGFSCMWLSFRLDPEATNKFAEEDVCPAGLLLLF